MRTTGYRPVERNTRAGTSSFERGGDQVKAKLAVVFSVAAMTALSVGTSGASAAHCVVSGTEPGFSYFGTDHVQETDHNKAGPGQPEGGNAHMGNPGASNCRSTTGSPSERAPGQN